MKVLIFLTLFFTNFLFYSFSQSVKGKIIIENGRSITNKKEVDLRILQKGANQVMIGNNSSFIGSKWEGIVSNKKIKLYGKEGVKTIYAKFKNNNGVVSDIVSTQIELDMTPPGQPSININSGQEYTNDKRRLVFLTLSCTDCHKMKISNREDIQQVSWKIYKNKVTNWQITGLEGLKVVYAQFADLAGNFTNIISDSIVLDLSPPYNLKMIVAGNKRYVKETSIDIDFFAQDAYEMIIYGLKNWIPFQKKYKYRISGEDGLKYIYVKFRDRAGNISSVLSSKFMYDTTPPQNPILIVNNGNNYINSFDEIQIQLLVMGASEMMISNREDFANATWVKYVPFLGSWPVEDIEGKKNIYVKFKDRADNISKVVSASIYLDKTPPKGNFVSIESPSIVFNKKKKIKVMNTDKKTVSLKLKSTDAAFMMISNTPSFIKSKWQIYSENQKTWELDEGNDGKRNVFVKFRDKAGNESQVINDMVFFDTEGPVREKVVINNQKQYTIDKQAQVDLSLFVQNASEMFISNQADFSKGKWEPYIENKKWNLSQGDGLKVVFVKYRDFAGNESKITTDKIILDTKAPSNGRVIINKNEKITNNVDKVVILNLKAEDAYMMQIGYEPSFNKSRWQIYTTKNQYWKLKGGDKKHTVYARFKDEAGNLSSIYSSSIILDTKPPLKGIIVINEGKKFINQLQNNKVQVSLEAKDAKYFRLSENFTFQNKDSIWKPFKNTIIWEFKEKEGIKTLYAQFKDRIGNISKTSYDKIGIDRKAPKNGRIFINNHEKYTTDINGYVHLHLYINDATEMLISNTVDFTDAQWQKLEFYLERWKLSEEDGEKTIYVKFRDQAKNESQQIQTSIILDRQGPFDEKVIIENNKPYINSKNITSIVNLKLYAVGATEMVISNTIHFKKSSWEPYKTEKTWRLPAGEGVRKVFAKFRDQAGNESFVAIDDILVDTKPPIPQFVTINNGKTGTENVNVILNLKAKDAKYMMITPNLKQDTYWREYEINPRWELKETPGLQTIYVKFKDEVDNETAPIKAQITYYKNN